MALSTEVRDHPSDVYVGECLENIRSSEPCVRSCCASINCLEQLCCVLKANCLFLNIWEGLRCAACFPCERR